MNIFDYIKKYGNYSFLEKKFNEIDNVIFSYLAYIDFSNIVSSDFKQKLTIEEASQIYFSTRKSIKKIIPAFKNSISILKKIMHTKRYKDVLVYGYQYTCNDQSQFGAVSFDLTDKLTYVSFEGTDQLLSGWFEDFMISYKFPVEAQKLSIKYLNQFLFMKNNLIIGGHSKGGHLAIISSMYCNFFIKKKIIKIYSNDGLGLRKKEYESRKYQKIKSKIIKLVPDYSIIGHLLNSDSNLKIIKSSKKTLSAHQPIFWLIKETKFIRNKNSKFCKVLEKALLTWSAQYQLNTKIELIESFFAICKSNKIETVYDIKKRFSFLLNSVLNSNDIDIKVKEMFKQLYEILRKCNKEYQEKDD